MRILKNQLNFLLSDRRSRSPGVINIYMKAKGDYPIQIHSIWYNGRRSLKKNLIAFEKSKLAPYLNRTILSYSIKRWYRVSLFGNRLKLFPAYDIDILISRHRRPKD